MTSGLKSPSSFEDGGGDFDFDEEGERSSRGKERACDLLRAACAHYQESVFISQKTKGEGKRGEGNEGSNSWQNCEKMRLNKIKIEIKRLFL